MRPATLADRPAIEAFLRAHVETSMFPLSNLISHGMGGGHPHATRFWLQGDPLTGLLAQTEEGMVMPQCPEGVDPAPLRGRGVLGLIGPAQQVAQLRALPGLAEAPVLLDETEPLFTLALADLVMPDCAGYTLVHLALAPRETVIAWRAQAAVETLGQPADTALARAAVDVDGWLARGDHRVLLRGETPVALTGFNARIPGVVQVGAVFTPAPLRGQGHARRAVALHLAEARAAGATRAILFSASDQASRAYRALGFHQIGAFGLTLFAGLQVVRDG